MHVNVKINQLKNGSASFAEIQKKLIYETNRIEEVIKSLKTMDNEALRDVAKKLEIQQNNIKVEAYRVESMEHALDQIIDAYMSTERNVVSYEVMNRMQLTQHKMGFLPIEPIKPKIHEAGIHFK